MFILTYSSPTTGEVTELFDSREAADAEAADVRRAMDAVGYGAHADSVRVQDTDGMTDAELWELPEDVQARIVAAEWEAHDRRIDADESEAHTMYAVTVYTADNRRAHIATVDEYHYAIAIATGVRATRHGNGATGGRVVVSEAGSPRAMWRMWDDGTAETL